jgi:hypothetical protein
MNKTLLVCLVTTLVSIAVVAKEHSDDGTGSAHRGKMGAMLMKKMDADGDQRVSKTEFNDFNSERFSHMDADDDGYLTAGEARAHHKKMRERRRAKQHKPDAEE